MEKQVALVTGASRGIGFGTALALANEGFSVALNASSGSEKLQASVDRLQKIGCHAIAVPFDVSEIGNHDHHLAHVEEELGCLTTLVNNAGVSVLSRGDPLDVEENSWDRCHSVNAKALFFLCQKFARRLAARKKSADLHHSIVNVTSANAVASAETRIEYCASKAAAAMVSKTLAVRLAREGIHVYDVQPGLIETDMTAGVIASYAHRAKAGLTLIPRVGTPDDIGTTIATLASGRLPYVTGQVISADGGLTVQRF